MVQTFSLGSPYVESLDKMIIRMFETGLIEKLEVQVFTNGVQMSPTGELQMLQTFVRKSRTSL